jgi:hypothetical protein
VARQVTAPDGTVWTIRRRWFRWPRWRRIDTHKNKYLDFPIEMIGATADSISP